MSTEERPVDRCVCANVRFADLIAIAEREGLSFEALCDRTGCCNGCGLCEPYVKLALRTGRERLPLLDHWP